jgi:hypothetical protein
MRKFTFFLLFSAVSTSLSQPIPNYNVIISDPVSSTGYYFIHTMKPGSSPAIQFNSMVIDRLGHLVFFKKYERTALDFKIQPNGQITYAYTFGGNANIKYFIMDSTFTVRDSVSCLNGITTDNHDLQILPNGHYLLLGNEFVVMDLSSYNWFSGNGSPGSSAANVLCGVIQVLDENKNAVFTWRAVDHYQFADVQEQWLFNPNIVDWTHFNSVELDNDGNILVSARNFSEVTKINRQTGSIIWRMGGKRNQFTFFNDQYNGFKGQHDARRISGENITLFDNGWLNASAHPARAVEYQVNEQNFTAQLMWSRTYSTGAGSRFLGSTQRLQNGNTVIGWGGLLNSNVTFSTVKADGSLIMEINFPETLYTYRALNYPELPWSLARPLINCFDSTGSHYLDAGAGYSSYLWSTGAVTQLIQITEPDTYYVFVPYGSGGYISSERVIITNMADPCGNIIGISENKGDILRHFKLYQNYPNPFNPVTRIKFDIPPLPYLKGREYLVRLTIYDILGREAAMLVNGKLKPGTYEADWNASNYPSGVYIYKLEVRQTGSSTGDFIQSKKMVLLK